jgi:hypothetical protein
VRSNSPQKKKAREILFHINDITYVIQHYNSKLYYKTLLTCRTGLVWSNSRQKKKAREILYKAHWTELLVSPWTSLSFFKSKDTYRLCKINKPLCYTRARELLLEALTQQILNLCKLSIGYCFRKIVFNISEVIGSFFLTGFDIILTLPSRISFINCSEKIFNKFKSWCTNYNLCALPASVTTIAVYISYLVQREVSTSVL